MPLLQIDYVPSKVDLKDLGPNHKLLSNAEISMLKEKHLSDRRYSKAELKNEGLNLSYSVTKVNGQHYAIYRGDKQGKALGAGSFGKVKLAQNLETGEWVAIKIIHEEAYDPQEIKSLETMGQVLGHYHRTVNKGEGREQREVIMRLAPGTELKTLVNSTRDIPTIKYLDIIIKIMKKTKKLHGKGIIHRDIKPRNIVFDFVRNKVKLIDLGLAREADEKGVYTSVAGAGTARYRAPEISRDKKNPSEHDKQVTYSEKTDIYALAVTFGDILGLELDHEKNHFEPAMLVAEGDSVDLKSKILNPTVEQQIINLLDSMVHRDPTKRPTVDEATAAFNNIREQHLDAFSKVSKIAYVDVVEYEKASPKEKKKMRKALSSMDEIVFVDHDGKNQAKYTALKREFEKDGHNVSNTVAQYRDPGKVDLPAVLAEHDAVTRPKTEDRVYLHYVVENKTGTLSPALQADLYKQGMIPVCLRGPKQMSREMGLPIDPENLQIMRKLIQAEMERVQAKDKNKPSPVRKGRADAMQKAIIQFDQLVASGKPIQYGTISNLFGQLEKNLKQYDRQVNLFGHKFSLIKTKTRNMTLGILKTIGNEASQAAETSLKLPRQSPKVTDWLSSGSHEEKKQVKSAVLSETKAPISPKVDPNQADANESAAHMNADSNHASAEVSHQEDISRKSGKHSSR